MMMRNGLATAATQATQTAVDDLHRQGDEGDAYQALTENVEMCWQRQVQKDDRGTERRDRECMPKRIQQAQPHTLPPPPLHARDIRDSGQVIVIEAVPKTQQCAGE